MMSHDSWFRILPVRPKFQVANSKCTNISADAVFSVLGVMTIIVPHYMKNRLKQSVSRHFT